MEQMEKVQIDGTQESCWNDTQIDCATKSGHRIAIQPCAGEVLEFAKSF